jgi:hypothetical protein
MNGFDMIMPLEDAVFEFQRLFDLDQLTAGMNLVTKIHDCDEKVERDGHQVPCPHRAIVQTAEMCKCEACGHSEKRVLVRRCILHHLGHLGRVEKYVSPQLDLTDASDVATVRAAQGADADEAARKILEAQGHTHSINGKTGEVHVLGAGHYAIEPSEVDPKLCVCGWEIASPLVPEMHDRRHEQSLSAIEPEEPAKLAGRKSRAGRGVATATK